MTGPKRATGRLWRLVALSTPGARLAAIGLVFAVLAAVGPQRLERAPRLCLFKRITDRQCWGCGITRALAAALRGEFRQAWGYNRLVAALLPVVAALVAVDLLRIARRRKEKAEAGGAASESPPAG